MSGRHAVAARPPIPWATYWANLRCHVGGHDWVHDGPGTWSTTCSRCGERYHVPEVRW